MFCSPESLRPSRNYFLEKEELKVKKVKTNSSFLLIFRSIFTNKTWFFPSDKNMIINSLFWLYLPEENRLSRELLLFRTDKTLASKLEVISVPGNMVVDVTSLEHNVLPMELQSTTWSPTLQMVATGTDDETRVSWKRSVFFVF